jgi:beta-galactosidase
MDRHGQLFEGPLAKPILPLIGGSIEAYDGLPEEGFGQIEMDGAKFKWGAWGDLLYAEPTTKVLAKYADQFYAGAAAVLHRKHGKGTVTYCGVTGEAAFTDALLAKIATVAKVPVMKLPPRVQVVKRGRYWIALNYQLTPFDAPAAKNARFLVGTRRVDPVSVAVWEE